MRLTEKAATAIAHLDTNENFKVYVAFIEDTLENLRAESDTLSTIDELKISQGKRQILVSLLKDIGSAREALRRYCS